MRYVERCLFDFRKNLSLIKNLQTEIINLKSVHGQNYNGGSGYGIPNPVFDVTAKILALEQKIKKIERRTRPVERLSRTLWSVYTLRFAQMAAILRLRYFNHHSVNKVIREMAISQPTYWRRNGELMRMAKKFLNSDT